MKHTALDGRKMQALRGLIRAVLMGTKSCTKILNFSTRFSCETFAVEDFVTLLMGKNLVDGEILCLGMISEYLYFYAGEIQIQIAEGWKWQRIFS